MGGRMEENGQQVHAAQEDPLQGCTTRALCASFDTPGDAFEWFGGATYAEVRDRELQIVQSSHRDGAEEVGLPAYMVFDVETDGGSPKQLVIQLAFMVFDAQDREVFRFNELLKLPPGKKINYYSIQVHKITDEVLDLRGVTPRSELATFFEWVDKVQAQRGLLIAHNAAFDVACVTNTAAENALPREICSSECFCTMRAATARCGLVDKRGRPKPPKNSVLYEILHGAPPDFACLHDALDDVRVTAASYQTGRQKGWWH